MCFVRPFWDWALKPQEMHVKSFPPPDFPRRVDLGGLEAFATTVARVGCVDVCPCDVGVGELDPRVLVGELPLKEESGGGGIVGVGLVGRSGCGGVEVEGVVGTPLLVGEIEDAVLVGEVEDADEGGVEGINGAGIEMKGGAKGARGRGA